MSEHPVSPGVLRTADQIEWAAEPWGEISWLAGSDIGNARGLTLGRMVMRPGGVNILHSHANCEEALVLLRGCVEHTIGGRAVVQHPGDVVVVPVGVSHRTANIGADDAELIITFSSGARLFQVEPEGAG